MIKKDIHQAVSCISSDGSVYFLAGGDNQYQCAFLGFYYQVAAAPWWLPVKGAYWKNPEGPDSVIKDR